MRGREEIRVRASCYDNEQYANSKYTYSWDHLLCQKATLFREVGINSIVPSIWRSCVASSRSLLLTSWDEWRRNSGITMAFHVMCSGMLLTCLKRRFSIGNCYLQVSSDDLRGGLGQRRVKGVKEPWNVRKLFPFADFANRDKRQNVWFFCRDCKSTPRPYAIGSLRLKRKLVGWVIIWFSIGRFLSGLAC